MAKAKDVKDQQFGKLTALGRQPFLDKNKHSIWSCRCACGKMINITLDRLTGAGSDSLSCGCEKPKQPKKATQLEQLVKAKNQAYTERNHLVSALSKLWPAWLERHPESDLEWENDWRWIVFIEMPHQLSWHIHDSELFLFDHLERRETNSWDGHTTEQKYARLASLQPRLTRQSVLDTQSLFLKLDQKYHVETGMVFYKD